MKHRSRFSVLGAALLAAGVLLSPVANATEQEAEVVDLLPEVLALHERGIPTHAVFDPATGKILSYEVATRPEVQPLSVE